MHPMPVLAVLAFALPLTARAEPPTGLSLRIGSAEAAVFARDDALMDWYPSSGGFRVTGGRSSNTKGRLVPYLGIGWQGNVMAGKVLIGLDMGALYDGRPELRMADGGRDTAAERPEPASILFHPAFSLTFTYRF